MKQSLINTSIAQPLSNISEAHIKSNINKQNSPRTFLRKQNQYYPIKLEKNNSKELNEFERTENIQKAQIQVENQLKNNELNQISETFRDFLENKKSVSQMMNQIQFKQIHGGTQSNRRMKHFSNQNSPNGSPLFKSKQILVAKSNTSVKMKMEQLNRENNNSQAQIKENCKINTLCYLIQ